MSWITKLCLLVLPVLALDAFAYRVNFNPSLEKAEVNTQIVKQSRGPAEVQVQFKLPYIDVESTRDGFDEIKVNGLNTLEVLGNPATVTTGQLIAVPEGYEADLTINENEIKTVENVNLKPFQRKYRCDCATDNFKFNAELYNSDATYPSQAASLEKVGKLQGLTLMRVAIHPVRMDMGRKELKVTSSLNVTVNFRQIKEARIVYLPKSLYQLVQGNVANLESQFVQPESKGETMLVIVADNLKSELTPFVNWKVSKGLKVDVATFTQAGGNKEKVKEYIKKYYDNARVKPSFLLMVGNKTTLPPYMESTSAGSAATDWTFSLLEGDDNIPDISYGRLLADDAVEFQTQLKRWINYEKNPEPGAWWSDASTIASSGAGSGPSDKEYAEQVAAGLKAGTYQKVDGFYQSEDSATASNIVGALNEGRSWLSYFGHGSGTAWASTNDTFDNKVVASLTNQRLPIIIDVACLNASWVNLSKPFGKAWVTQENNGKATGAVAFYGGSVSISWDPPAVMSVGIAKNFFEKKLKYLGPATLGGQLYLVEKMGVEEDVIDNFRWYNLLGDPSLEVRTKTP